MAVIQIGAAKSMREPEGFGCTPDDRQELVKCINGVFPVDAGSCPEGDAFNFTAVFSPAAWSVLYGYWRNRIKVDVIDQNGDMLNNMRVVVKKYDYVNRHKFYKITFELWRV